MNAAEPARERWERAGWSRSRARSPLGSATGSPFAPVIIAVAMLAVGCHAQVDATPGSSGASGGRSGSGGTAAAGGAPGAAAGGSTGTGSTSGTGSTTTPGMGGSGGAVAALDCKTPHAAPVRARLLSSSQYSNTVLDLLQVAGDPGQPFGDKVFEGLDDTRVEQRANVAATVAQQATLTLSKWAPCTPPATGDASACEGQIIDKIGASAYRHPLSAEERTQLKTLFDAGIKEKDFSTGVEWFLTGVLQSPDFMYELVKPAPTEQPGEVRPLAPYDYASRLAYFIWNSLPDDKLLAAASTDDLSDPTKRQAQLTRMFQDPRFMRGVEGFYSRWLNLAAFHELARNAAGFTQDVAVSLSTSLLMSATQLYSSATPNISSLFSGDSYYMDDVLRKFYGLSGTGTAFTAVKMPGETRRGLLTHPALMALLARPDQSFPISRGLFVLRSVLCRQMPLPNGLTIPELPPIQDGVTTRQRLEMHASNRACAVCHDTINPPGFALESFDEVGKFRTVDHGQPVNTSGALTLSTDLDGTFSTGDELLAKMPGSASVRGCFAEQYLRFALSRQESDTADACSIQALGKDFTPSGDLKQLVVSIVNSDAFRMRLAEGVAK